jgi:hypothetical protein
MTHRRKPPASATTLPADGTTGRARRARIEPMLVRSLRNDRYIVETAGGTYVVDLEGATCTCPDAAIRTVRCKHLRRVAIEVNEGRIAPPGMRAHTCAVCGSRLFVPVADRGPALCESHRHRVGDVVRDRESGDLLLVTADPNGRADVTTTEDGRAISEFPTNEHYGAHEPVVEAVYLGSVDPRRGGERALSTLKRYQFPASRLVRTGRNERRLVDPPVGDRQSTLVDV